MTYKYIKKLVESTSGIEDIGIKSRHKYVRDARYVYARLCFLYVERFRQVGCGKVINRDHSTISNALKVFKEGIDKSWFTASETYHLLNSKLKNDAKRLH